MSNFWERSRASFARSRVNTSVFTESETWIFKNVDLLRLSQVKDMGSARGLGRLRRNVLPTNRAGWGLNGVWRRLHALVRRASAGDTPSNLGLWNGLHGMQTGLSNQRGIPQWIQL
jgi:hypothetical protein